MTVFPSRIFSWIYSGDRLAIPVPRARAEEAISSQISCAYPVCDSFAITILNDCRFSIFTDKTKREKNNATYHVVQEIRLSGEPETPCINKGAVWGKRYQRRTLTGIGRRKKTVRSCTGKTPRTIVSAHCANTSASIMVR